MGLKTCIECPKLLLAWQILSSLQQSAGSNVLRREKAVLGLGTPGPLWGADGSPGLQGAGVIPGMGLAHGGCCPAALTCCGGRGKSRSNGDQCSLLWVSRAPVGLGAAGEDPGYSCITWHGRGRQGLLPCAKAPQEDPGNPCPGEMVILSLLKDSDIFLLLSY